MNSLRNFAFATLIVAAPSLAVAQGKAHHPAPPVTMGKSAPVRQDNRADKIADHAARNADKAADKSEHKAEKAADKAEHSADKTERSELKFAHDQKLLTKGIRLTSAEEKQLKAIEKKYDADYRSLRKKELAADKAAKKSGKADSDAAFESELAALQSKERAEMRAVLTPEQQSVFDSNVAKVSTQK